MHWIIDKRYTFIDRSNIHHLYVSIPPFSPLQSILEGPSLYRSTHLIGQRDNNDRRCIHWLLRCFINALHGNVAYPVNRSLSVSSSAKHAQRLVKSNHHDDWFSLYIFSTWFEWLYFLNAVTYIGECNIGSLSGSCCTADVAQKEK